MSDNNPSMPTGGLPPKPEAAKVQPKKETVRINLPPKPSAAPTIKLPTLPPGGPSTASGFQAAPQPPAPGAPALTSSASAKAAAPAAAPAAAAAQPRPVARPSVPASASLSGIDKGLAIAAAVAGLVALGATHFCMSLFKDVQ